MAEVTITIGGRPFQVVCQEGEEAFLQSAARMLDTEAQQLESQIGRLTESRLLLMAGLMLADRTAAVEDENMQLKKAYARAQGELHSIKKAPPPEPKKIEVPVVPQEVHDGLAELSEAAEVLSRALAD